MTYQKLTALLKREMVPAHGCTGPTAYALAAARCRPHLTEEPESMTVYVSPAFLKIGFGVATPGTATPGIAIAAAVGLMGGDHTLGLNVLKPCTQEDIDRAHRFVADGKVRIESDPAQSGVYVRAEVRTRGGTVTSVVSGTHDGISLVTVDGKEIFRRDPVPDEIQPERDELTLESIFRYVRFASMRQLRFLLKGYRMNIELAEDGLRQEYGMKSARAYLAACFPKGAVPEDLYTRPLAYLPGDLGKRIQILVAAASDARMGGSRLPAMIAMGDGNQGITAMVPVGLAAEQYCADEERTLRALALSCLITFYVKTRVGRASAFCLCAIAASAGAAAGIAFLKNMDDAQLRAAVKNVISPLAGMLCDGAKNSCALKMAIAATAALTAVQLAEAGLEVGYYDGVADDTLEDTVDCITSIASQSQTLLDNAMVEKILEREERKRSAG